MPARRIYAIGDVHGRADLLAPLLDFIAGDSEAAGRAPEVVFLGDIVDRGRDSRRALQLVVETLRRWPGSRLILGNHDSWFLSYLRGDRSVASLWLPQGGLETLDSYLPDGRGPDGADAFIRETFPEHLAALEEASLMRFENGFAFVHAGVAPGRPLDAQLERDCLWIREPFLDHVGTLSHVVVHGHTPLHPPRPEITENRISLDTGAFATDVLTVMSLDPDAGALAFHATGAGGKVQPIAPVRLDRGLGTVLDRFELRPAAGSV